MNGEEQINAKREAAARARRLAPTLTLQADRDRMLAFAGNLDAEADALERSTRAPPAPQ
jgi:hypothetical protein